MPRRQRPAIHAPRFARVPGLTHGQQHGIATVLIVLLLGLSVTAGVLGTASYIRGTQEQDVAVHAQTQAQMKAWTGAELVGRYLQGLQGTERATLLDKSASAQQPLALAFTGEGVGADSLQASLVHIDKDHRRVTARITGKSASGTRAQAQSVLEVVYEYGAGGASGSPPPAQPKASAVFRGDVNISGGTTSFSNTGNEHRLEKIAVDGSLTISSASQAKIAGCAKGDIQLSGGGIDDNASLLSQNGSITLGSISMPKKGTKLWGRDIHIGNSGSGVFESLRAGAYQTNVLVGNVIVGTAHAGGKPLRDPDGSVLPWETGLLQPWPSGKQLIALNDGGEYLLDMAKTRMDAATGLITVDDVADAVEKVSKEGSREFPDSFTLQSTGIYGGAINVHTLDVTNETWGYHIALQGYNGNYAKVWPAGHLKAVTANIAHLQGGGDLWASAGGCNPPSNCWNFPTISKPSPIAGTMYYGASKTPLAGPYGNIKTQQKSTTPGLPGAPFCDTRVHGFDAAAYRAQANYIFEFDSNGNPRLTIQNVNVRPGNNQPEVSIARANIDLKSVDPVSSTLPQNMQLRRIKNKNFLGCSNQDPGNQWSDALACLRSSKPTTGWNLTGITKFPPGIALFIGPVTIDGVSSSQGALHNTLLATGNITLTGAGHGALIAPNFSPIAKICGADFYPTNLCESATKLVTYQWTQEGEKKESTGEPLANIAIGTNADFKGNSWDGDKGIKGHVIIGKSFSTGGATVKVNGTITVGVNDPSPTTIAQGGFQIDTTHMTLDQMLLPPAQAEGGSGGAAGSGGAGAGAGDIAIKWSRYL